MAKFLASVSTIEEVRIGLEAQADIIDLKDPERGALGRVNDDIISEAQRILAGGPPVSATIGDLPMEPDLICHAVDKMATHAVDYIKIGFFPGGDPARSIVALKPFAQKGIKLVGVLFADRHVDFTLIDVIGKSGFSGVMVDTADKKSGYLLDHMTDHRAREFLCKARENNLFAGLAGSLQSPHIARLLAFKPDLLGFRSALCKNGQRKEALDIAACRQIRSLIPSEREGL